VTLSHIKSNSNHTRNTEEEIFYCICKQEWKGVLKSGVYTLLTFVLCECRPSSVSIVTRLRAGRPGFDSRQWQGLLFAIASRPALRSTHPPFQWVPKYLPSEVKRPWREADHSPPSTTEVKNA
jgi:hypothetical protein